MSFKNILYYIFIVFRVLLYPFALIYGSLVWLRNRLYDIDLFSSVEFSVPVITVGNLSVGGTGKTPHVEYLIRLLQYRFKVATMSRGYKRLTQGFIIADDQTNALRIGDEPMQYHIKFPELVVSVAEERMTGIPLLLQKKPEIEVVLLDDAYQHRSVKAGINILITDYSAPFYNDFILPFGGLREGRNAYKRADIIIVSKCPADITTQKATEITNHIKPLEKQRVFFTKIQYDAPYHFLNNEYYNETNILKNTNVILVCCIAKPQPLINYLKLQATDVHVLTYRDHHYFTTPDIEEIKSAYDNWTVENKLIVSTEKDAARLQLHTEKLKEWGITILVLPIVIKVLFNKEQELDALITDYVEQALIENQEIGIY